MQHGVAPPLSRPPQEAIRDLLRGQDENTQQTGAPSQGERPRVYSKTLPTYADFAASITNVGSAAANTTPKAT